MWLMQSSYRLFGIGEWQARLPTAVMAWLLLAIVSIWTTRTISPYAGLVTGLILLGTPHFVKEAKVAHLENPLSLFVTISLLAFYSTDKRTQGAVVCGICTGLAFLTKWIAGIFAPIIQLCLILVGFNKTVMKNKWWWSGYIIGVCIAIPWFVHHYFSYPKEFIDTYFGRTLISSLTTVISHHSGNLLFYLKIFLRKARPWGLFFIPVLAYLSYFSLKKDTISQFLLCWLSIIFVLFSIATTKLHRYIIPIYPVLAISLAYIIKRTVKQKKHRIYVVIAAVLIILVHILSSHHFRHSDYNRRITTLTSHIKSDIEHEKTIYMYLGRFKPSLIFYTDKLVHRFQTPQALLEQLNDKGKIILLAEQPDDKTITKLIEEEKCKSYKKYVQVDDLFVFYLQQNGSSK